MLLSRVCRWVGALRRNEVEQSRRAGLDHVERKRQSIGVSTGDREAPRCTGKHMRLRQAVDRGCGRSIDRNRGVCDRGPAAIRYRELQIHHRVCCHRGRRVNGPAMFSALSVPCAGALQANVKGASPVALPFNVTVPPEATV